MQHMTLRSLALLSQFMVFASSLIVTGIISYFIHKYSFRNTHIVFQEGIATVTLAVYAISMITPILGQYKGHLVPFSLAMSYLWLTSFILATQDWAGGRCSSNGPTLSNCGLKKTVAAFDFLALFFLLCSVVVEWLLVRQIEGDRHAPVKERGVSHSTVNSTPGAINTVTGNGVGTTGDHAV